MKNINYTKVKIIEEPTPKRVEYELNDFIEHCRKKIIPIIDVTEHVTVNPKGSYKYTFIVKYCPS